AAQRLAEAFDRDRLARWRRQRKHADNDWNHDDGHVRPPGQGRSAPRGGPATRAWTRTRQGPTLRLACTVTPCWMREDAPLFCASTLMPAAALAEPSIELDMSKVPPCAQLEPPAPPAPPVASPPVALPPPAPPPAPPVPELAMA